MDVRGEFATEVIDLGNNTSPFKKQKVLRDCLQDGEIKSHRSKKYKLNPVKKYNFSSTALQSKTQTEFEDGEISCEVQDRLGYNCEGEF